MKSQKGSLVHFGAIASRQCIYSIWFSIEFVVSCKTGTLLLPVRQLRPVTPNQFAWSNSSLYRRQFSHHRPLLPNGEHLLVVPSLAFFAQFHVEIEYDDGQQKAQFVPSEVL